MSQTCDKLVTSLTFLYELRYNVNSMFVVSYRNQKVVLAIQMERFKENVTSTVQMALGCLSH